VSNMRRVGFSIADIAKVAKLPEQDVKNILGG